MFVSVVLFEWVNYRLSPSVLLGQNLSPYIYFYMLFIFIICKLTENLIETLEI